MNDREEFLDAVHGELTFLILCYPDYFNEDTGTYETVVERLFEEWQGFRSFIKRDLARLDEIEAMIKQALAMMEAGPTKDGRFLLQDIRAMLPSLKKLK